MCGFNRMVLRHTLQVVFFIGLTTRLVYQYISYRTENVWPSHSLDLNPLDFCLCSYLKDRVYYLPHKKQKTLNSNYTRNKINPADTCKYVIKNFRNHVQSILKAKGDHLEYML